MNPISFTNTNNTTIVVKNKFLFESTVFSFSPGLLWFINVINVKINVITREQEYRMTGNHESPNPTPPHQQCRQKNFILAS